MGRLRACPGLRSSGGRSSLVIIEVHGHAGADAACGLTLYLHCCCLAALLSMHTIMCKEHHTCEQQIMTV
jgi:hypothetical protein